MDVKFKKISLEEVTDEYINYVSDFFNYHRKLTKAPKSLWQKFDESKETLTYWINEGEFSIITVDKENAGFIYYKYINDTFVRLEDIYLCDNLRGKGIGKTVIGMLDDLLKSKGVIACSVNVIPRNESAIKFYIDCGFDHLNMIEIRKNYDKSFDKSEVIDILGHKLIKY